MSILGPGFIPPVGGSESARNTPRLKGKALKAAEQGTTDADSVEFLIDSAEALDQAGKNPSEHKEEGKRRKPAPHVARLPPPGDGEQSMLDIQG